MTSLWNWHQNCLYRRRKVAVISALSLDFIIDINDDCVVVTLQITLLACGRTIKNKMGEPK